jgi:inosine/xanthosine triphosphatase
MKHVVVASTNPIKVNAVLMGFQQLFRDEEWQVIPLELVTKVSNQPIGEPETRRGADLRIQAAQDKIPGADFWAGIEGGVEDVNGQLYAFAWVIIRSSEGLQGMARSGSFLLPPTVSTLVRAGVELGDADDQVFGRTDSKLQNGAIGLLTGDVLDRTDLYVHAILLALVPFRNPTLYGEKI